MIYSHSISTAVIVIAAVSSVFAVPINVASVQPFTATTTTQPGVVTATQKSSVSASSSGNLPGISGMPIGSFQAPHSVEDDAEPRKSGANAGGVQDVNMDQLEHLSTGSGTTPRVPPFNKSASHHTSPTEEGELPVSQTEVASANNPAIPERPRFGLRQVDTGYSPQTTGNPVRGVRHKGVTAYGSSNAVRPVSTTKPRGFRRPGMNAYSGQQ
ncbi:hypothetical protein LENED_004437 [Lentinula edodes]|uniref:Uncharacterized protein n=1 Tax=Lentinula edodes TaxID=5353 RepID=A0A1Q3E6X0_LENED|nr:uncharacterized protein C8R40DRAFT_48170 [Lentinula edodes]KAH7881510.1 hypothetical protein C8R40DRAFT_48170 [Lentinula edodes]GAW02769.1 hypothetical protein LENED_004437 [Lentinula edodes]